MSLRPATSAVAPRRTAKSCGTSPPKRSTTGTRRHGTVPGAFSYLGQRKLIVWRSRVLDTQHDKQPGTVLSTSPLVIACGEGALEIVAGQNDSGLYVQGSRPAQEMGIVTDVRPPPSRTP